MWGVCRADPCKKNTFHTSFGNPTINEFRVFFVWGGGGLAPLTPGTKKKNNLHRDNTLFGFLWWFLFWVGGQGLRKKKKPFFFWCPPARLGDKKMGFGPSFFWPPLGTFYPQGKFYDGVVFWGLTGCLVFLGSPLVLLFVGFPHKFLFPLVRFSEFFFCFTSKTTISPHHQGSQNKNPHHFCPPTPTPPTPG